MEKSLLTSNSPPRIVGEELEVQQGTTAARPPAQNLLPASLLLVAVREGDVDMLQREVRLGQLLETQDVGILGSILLPGAFLDERRSDLCQTIKISSRAVMSGTFSIYLLEFGV